jgi:hypothetical protein
MEVKCMQNATFGRRTWSHDSSTGRILSLVVMLAGLWQVVAPFVLNFADEQTALRTAVGTGIVLALFAGLGAFGINRWSRNKVSIFDGLASLAGLWLIISPFVLQYREVAPAFWSAILIGLLSFACAGFAAIQKHDADAPVTS